MGTGPALSRLPTILLALFPETDEDTVMTSGLAHRSLLFGRRVRRELKTGALR
ncbi:hypothetical protein MAMT_01470 [Methylacidimicrobium tartarophylax]|uniref:Uncharacterized protein n=1 Tax=Methylacidimicrobium tartarophylax TaxID=1041768 RepID=A0A5E6MGG5_9BACT|nr:hypothetical protein MAMT_01470 [Methylacidimicrobium tartarophylax]